MFYNGFEYDTEINYGTSGCFDGDPRYDCFLGGDFTTNYPNQWNTDLRYNYDLGNFNAFKIYYAIDLIDPGVDSQRKAEVIPNPYSSDNNNSDKVFYTWANSGYGANNQYARVQPSLSSNQTGSNYNSTGFEILHYSFKFYLPNQFQTLINNYPNHILDGGRLTIIQLWNKNGDNASKGLRLNTAIKKDFEDDFFSFYIVAQDLPSKDVEWKEDFLETPIPIGQWNTLDVYFKEGGFSEGYYRLKLNGEIVFSGFRQTKNDYDNNPDGLTELDPFELYTFTPQLVDPLFGLGYKTEIFWDDFTIYGDTKLRQKYIKVGSPTNDTVITNNNLSLYAQWINATEPYVGLPYDWKYIFWISNRDDSSNIIYTPGQKTRHLDLTPYRDNGQLRDSSRYRVYTAIRNHPFLNKFGSWPNYHMDFETNFNGKSIEIDFKIYPNPTKDCFTIEIDNDRSLVTNFNIYDKFGFIVFNANERKLTNNNYKLNICGTNIGLKAGIYFCEYVTAKGKIIKKLIFYN